MFDWKEIQEKITVANDDAVIATKIGKIKVTSKDKTGREQKLILKDVRYIPGFGKYNLLSLTKIMSNDFSISNEGQTIVMKKGKTEIPFDRIIKTRTGHLVATELVPRKDGKDEEALVSIPQNVRMNVNEFHNRMGHMSEKITRSMAKEVGIHLTGTFKVCKACAEAKAKQKNVGKEAKEETKAKEIGEQLWMDVSSIKHKSFGGACFWLLIVDEYSDYCWSHFMKNKSDVPHYLSKTLNELEESDIKVKTIRCDNAGENYKAEEKCKEEKRKIIFQFTAPNTPQHNG